MNLLPYRRFGLQAIAQKAWGDQFETLVAGQMQAMIPTHTIDGDAAIVTIRGPLVHHRHLAWDSYEWILERNKAAFADPSAKRVIWLIDSPGGDVDGCFETTYALRELARQTGKPLWVYTDSMAASAAYALACAADRIVCSQTGALGSIGIIEALRSQVKADAARGEEYDFVTSGEHKADGNPHVPISVEARANLQKQVNQMADVFFSLVEEFREIPYQKVKGLQARMLYGKATVEAGLADELGMWPNVTHEPIRAEAQNGTTSQASRPSMKAGYLRHMLRSLAESEDDEVSESEKKHAKRMLKSLEEGEPDDGAPPEKKKDEAEGKKAEGEGKKAAVHKAEGDGEGKTASAEGDGEGEGKKAAAKKADAEAEGEGEGEGEGKKAAAKKADAEGEGEGEGKKGMAASSALERMGARLQTLEARDQFRNAQARREKLMATRPDLTDEVREWLDNEPLDVVERALKTLPQGPARGTKLSAMAAASQTQGTRGKGNNNDGTHDVYVPPEESDFIARKMGASAQGSGIKRSGRVQELGFMTPEQAKKFLEDRKAAGQEGQ